MVKLKFIEQQIVEMTARGMSEERIAIETGFKPGTISRYKYELFTEYDLKNSPHMVAWAYETGVLKIGGIKV